MGAAVNVRYNLVTHYAYPGDWAWIIQGVPKNFSVADANALRTSEVRELFEEMCWFYFAPASEPQDQPFLCSTAPDAALASLQSNSAKRSYQYGRVALYPSKPGNTSLWFAKKELFVYVDVTTFYTCGMEVQPLASHIVSVRSQR